MQAHRRQMMRKQTLEGEEDAAPFLHLASVEEACDKGNHPEHAGNDDHSEYDSAELR